ncbi:MAG: ABC transporter permease [Defluviitaleaceae bacterium]|nr:ABC transporter permease [Defluviitaleaceae bacterium]MCL2240017.1 ABC transporter permease [Defluviitaleaceae bacterium]MCL2240690.1 ABC transporter permease [Defluviitaleaceae bacterium]
MRNTMAIFIKQMRSMVKSPALLVQGAMFAIMIVAFSFIPDRYCDLCVPAVICETCLRENPLHSLPTPSISGVFTVMFAGFVMISSASALVQEDKTTQNLRFLTMSGMKPFQYLTGTGAALLIIAAALLVFYAMAGRHFGMNTLLFLAVTTSGALVSILLGIAIGLSKVPVFAFPVSIIFGMGPMLSQFNETLARWMYFTYTQQVNLAIYNIGYGLQPRTFLIIGINGLVILLTFVWMHRKGELRW